MLTHKQIWNAIDGLAARHDLSASGLAKISGLDPTTFNKSKRIAANGKERWPSTESVSKVLASTGESLEGFVGLASARDSKHPVHFLPLLGLAQAGEKGFFDDSGILAAHGWDQIEYPGMEDDHAYALEITGDSMLPIYRDGDRIVVSPSASVRRGDRVLVKTHAGEVMAQQLARATAQRIELQSFNAAYEIRAFDLSDVAFMHRILWASQ
jgi:phage repressor protein C with HTH and peptisase S24 domain